MLRPHDRRSAKDDSRSIKDDSRPANNGGLSANNDHFSVAYRCLSIPKRRLSTRKRRFWFRKPCLEAGKDPFRIDKPRLWTGKSRLSIDKGSFSTGIRPSRRDAVWRNPLWEQRVSELAGWSAVAGHPVAHVFGGKGRRVARHLERDDYQQVAATVAAQRGIAPVHLDAIFRGERGQVARLGT